ncbi:hypothetical protein ASPZODRAFT_1106889 [Penicilliopsis zonata CBS 506.65]|uniref:Ketoreductase domain-containing protein n=1 Tax=Penicilliopsis zonata CBS 506.65 TaxID=1073090 RepID=A0A1L9SSN4_9EURO|nr:hypothetical protein ASPZODRAFT_1106889 [Penicilliopsis zonata CBS 506.65]OJJ50126.1 hypothetical protein ASPZODRAFT_1106889 [Penicilliopsis zonata CBS 506.65]
MVSKQKTILVTGASGFMGTHIVEEFLSAGYIVRGTVRSEEAALKVRRTFPDQESRLDLTIVPDMAQAHAFDEAVKDVHGVVHNASPFHTQVQSNERELLRPSIDGTTNILSAVQAHAPDVKRVVLTSSFAAMVDMSLGNRPGHVYSEKDWNPITYQQAKKALTPPVLAYTAAKTGAEHAAWDFMQASYPHFDLVTILPAMVYGPNRNATANLASLNTSSADLYRIMSPESKPDDPVPPNVLYSWVDVRDVAFAHRRAFEVPEAGGNRFFLCEGNFTNQQVADILRDKLPELRSRVPVGTPGSGFEGVDMYKIDHSRSEKVLGVKYHSLEQTVVDSAKAFLQLEQRMPVVV